MPVNGHSSFWECAFKFTWVQWPKRDEQPHCHLCCRELAENASPDRSYRGIQVRQSVLPKSTNWNKDQGETSSYLIGLLYPEDLRMKFFRINQACQRVTPLASGDRRDRQNRTGIVMGKEVSFTEFRSELFIDVFSITASRLIPLGNTHCPTGPTLTHSTHAPSRHKSNTPFLLTRLHGLAARQAPRACHSNAIHIVCL